MFQAFGESTGQEGIGTLDAARFVAYCHNTPEITSWLCYCGHVPDAECVEPSFVDLSAEHLKEREAHVSRAKRCAGGTDADA